MQFSLIAAAAFLAIPVMSSTTVPAGALQLNIKRSTQEIPELVARDEESEAVHIPNQKYYYSTTIKVGNPPQDVEVLVDTSSPDTILFSPESEFNGEVGNGPASKFDASKSETWEQTEGAKFDVEGSVGKSTGKLGSDTLRMGDKTVENVTIGIVDKSSAQHNVLGVGRGNNVLDKMYEAGDLSSPAFSLSLGENDEDEGSMLLGAVDHSKYTGKLVSLATSRGGSSGTHYGVQVNSIHADGRASQNILTQPMTAVLDSGSRFSYFPNGITRSLYEVLNANPSFSINLKYYADCNITDNLVIDFGATQIKVPNYYFLTPIENFVNRGVAGVAFPQNSCYVGIDNSPGNYIVLGENLIRSSYIVYDGKNSQVAIGQANFDKRAEPEIELIGEQEIPGAVPY